MAARDPDAADALLEVEDAATQRRFVQAYDSSTVDGDELGTALGRYDDLDADERVAFDELFAHTGNDAADFAARTDADTFDDIVSPCGASFVSSFGGAGVGQPDSYHSVAAPSATLAQSGGSCPTLPTDVRDSFVRAVSDISDSELRDVDTQGALRSITDFDRDAQDAATDLIDEADASGVRTVNDIDELIKSGQMDQSDVGAFTDILRSRDSNELIDSDVEADDVLTVADRGDISDT